MGESPVRAWSDKNKPESSMAPSSKRLGKQPLTLSIRVRFSVGSPVGKKVIRKSKYTKELLEPIVKKEKSTAGVIKSLGLKVTGGNYRNINSKIKHCQIDTSHFTGSLWSRGLTSATSEIMRKASVNNHLTDSEIFIENSSVGSSVLRKRYLRTNLPYKCSDCNIDKWKEKPITLHLDHRNGIRNDNRLENLRWLCPNCHQQTDTWGNKRAAVLELVDKSDLDSEAKLSSVGVRVSPAAPLAHLGVTR